MPFLLLTALIAVAATSDDRGTAASARPQPRAVAGKLAPAPVAAVTPVMELDQKSPSKWWLEQMQRPCVLTGKRATC